MIFSNSLKKQRGATLVVGLIMLALITVMVATAFTLSTTNLKSVGNMQFRNEALAAANKAIEQVLSSPFTLSPTAETIEVDINNDDTADYTVAIATPVCVRATPAGTTTKSSISLGQSMSMVTDWNTVWELDATVTDAKSGAFIRTRSGVRVVRSDSQKKTECP
ncbi:pilus assembly PilX N-terminal domain-containing protein [Oxalobacteraceae bacterium R-40]|uniref:Pilus assembly PilX N-terminal domain-containing protein n=1 Tax=Keguizhuia sedimenti TaxID=3064264 RepID=A0ABU1BN99_9BURK|nr:pilus assembly PilX N-terminal domain-containing protein [Oxalobacteraceae bacterium R-40]